MTRGFILTLLLFAVTGGGCLVDLEPYEPGKAADPTRGEDNVEETTASRCTESPQRSISYIQTWIYNGHVEAPLYYTRLPTDCEGESPLPPTLIPPGETTEMFTTKDLEVVRVHYEDGTLHSSWFLTEKRSSNLSNDFPIYHNALIFLYPDHKIPKE